MATECKQMIDIHLSKDELVLTVALEVALRDDVYATMAMRR